MVRSSLPSRALERRAVHGGARLALVALALAGCERVSGLSELTFECFPEGAELTCEGVVCGSAINNCGDEVECPDTCQGVEVCEAGGAPENTCGCTGGARTSPEFIDGCTRLDGQFGTGNWYYFCEAPMSFADARSFCRSFGTDLVIIDGIAENQVVRQIIPDNVWLGLSDPARTLDPYDFVWVDGSAAGFTNWYPGEPNNTGGGEHCAEMMAAFNGLAGYWNDLPCDNVKAVLCETTCPPLPVP